MRLHRLEIQAFGSFPGREVIDFDELCEAGLFLVHGHTGSGKTTILDAVSFALYGDVPGERDKTGLRSHHAPPDVRTEVELEATLGSRRVHIRRTPHQTRPAKRGSGMVDDNPTVVLSELVDGEWTNEITRLDEAGMRVTDLLGMGPAQFRQVAMLPQGGFAEFLNSPAKDRKKLLEQLFDTSRFDRVEQWLGERARELSQQVDTATVDLRAAEREVQRLVDDAAEPVPEIDLRDLPSAERAAVVRRDCGLRLPDAATDEQILRAHDADYLHRVRYGLLTLRMGDKAEAVRALQKGFELANLPPADLAVRDLAHPVLRPSRMCNLRGHAAHGPVGNTTRVRIGAVTKP